MTDREVLLTFERLAHAGAFDEFLDDLYAVMNFEPRDHATLERVNERLFDLVGERLPLNREAASALGILNLLSDSMTFWSALGERHRALRATS